MFVPEFKSGILYSKWYRIILAMVIISLIIGSVFTVFLGKEFTILNMMLPSLINTVVLWVGSSAIVVFVWKKFPWESNPVKHLFYEIILITGFLVLFILIANTIVSNLENIPFLKSLQKYSIDILVTVLITFLIITIHEAVFFYQQWKLNFSKSVRLEKDNLEAQYNALKAQVNPHFLFNSLNSLITLLDKNPVAEKYVQDLSDYLRYVLLSNTRETVTLKEELENSEKYIYLQKQRFIDNFEVNFEIDKSDLLKHIPPLALQMLLENCFNHNIVSKNKPLRIKVYTKQNSITVENNLQKKENPHSTGQGLKNIEGRYRFAGSKAVKIVEDDLHFAVSIPLIDQN